MMNNVYIKSPMNYIGGKYKLLPQILPYFPKEINTFVDLFCGGLDVSINTKAKSIIANDNNYLLIDMYKEMQKTSLEELLDYIENQIALYDLSKENAIGYNDFREKYNKEKYPLDLFVLICYSFNHQLRFNGNMEFNNPFGKNRSCYNENIKNNLILMKKKLDGVCFSSEDFSLIDYSKFNENDFFYCDPPYLITCGSYNDGKRGFKGWNEKEELCLYELLDKLNERNIKFCLSNVIEHNGKRNEILNEWMKNYKVVHLEKEYANSSYQKKNRECITKEILVLNY